MTLNKRSSMPYRRKRAGRTDYRKRLTLLSSREVRLVVRLSERNALAQLVEYSPQGDKVLVSASSKEIERLGWKAARGNLSAAYLVGALLASKALKLESPVGRAVLDIGRNRSLVGSRVYAVLAGAVEAGLDVPHSEDILPPKERVCGKHIEDYAKKLKKEDPKRYERQFSAILKAGVDPTAFISYFNAFKTKVVGSR